MKQSFLFLAALLALSGPGVRAQDVDAIEGAARPALAVVEEFSAALQAGDLARVESLLDPALLVLEGGGAERSRAEYLREHAGADAKFLEGAKIRILRRRAGADAEFAWVATESELQVDRDGTAKNYLSTETMVLRRVGEAWKIVHIHWSSRPKEN